MKEKEMSMSKNRLFGEESRIKHKEIEGILSASGLCFAVTETKALP